MDILDYQIVSRRVRVLTGFLLACGILLWDSYVSLGVAMGEFYVILELLALYHRERQWILWSAIVGSLFTVIGFYISPPGGVLWEAVANRIIAIVVIWTIAYLSTLQSRSLDKLQMAHRQLEERVRERTAELERANERIRRESSYIELQKDVAFFSNENRSVEEAMRYGLNRVCGEMGWPVGHLYVSRENSEGLDPSAIWYFADTVRFEVLRKATESTVLAPGEGLPGRVLLEKKPLWIRDVTQDPNFPRAKLAEDIGVRSGFAFPLLVGSSVVGVMEFFSPDIMDLDSGQMEILANIGTQLGRVIERKRAESALVKQKLEHEIIFHSVPAMIWYLDRDDRVLRINKEGADYIGLPVERITGRRSFEVFPFQGDFSLSEDMEVVVSGVGKFGIVRAFEARPGDIRWVQMDKVPYRDENGLTIGVVVFALDITDRKRAEEDIMKSRGQLRELYQRIEQVREEERSRIAREVHDELGQLLTTLKLEWSLLEKKLNKEERDFLERWNLMRDLIDSSMQTVKRISTDLRPPILDVFGLSEAIEWQGQEFQDRTGVLFEFSADPGGIHVDKERATTLFRIFQETLTNVARHAKATAINASLTCDAGMYILKVEDNGVGADASQISDLRSLGILGMRERALIWGGTVDIHGVPGKGTTVTIKISR